MRLFLPVLLAVFLTGGTFGQDKPKEKKEEKVSEAGIGSAVKTVLQVFDLVVSYFEKSDKIEKIAKEHYDKWNKTITESTEQIKAITKKVKELPFPKKKDELTDLRKDLEAMVELTKNEIANLKLSEEKLKKDVEKCLKEKKSTLSCDAIIEKIDLATFRAELNKLVTESGKKVEAIDAAIKKLK